MHRIMADVFISGGTGYLGRQLIPQLLARGHGVGSIARPGSESKLPNGCRSATADALTASTFTAAIAPADTFIHLTGTPKPAPWKEREFRAVDKPSLEASVDAAVRSGTVRHFIYVSVAHPAPIMRAYIAVRRECEECLSRRVAVRTILRPWYVLGPGHWWPYALKPFYALAARSATHRDTAARLGLVTLPEMTAALLEAVENPPEGQRIVDVPGIRAAAGRYLSA
jgi:uncharacterized protein YbjT (DUF2867 family)